MTDKSPTGLPPALAVLGIMCLWGLPQTWHWEDWVCLWAKGNQNQSPESAGLWGLVFVEVQAQLGHFLWDLERSLHPPCALSLLPIR